MREGPGTSSSAEGGVATKYEPKNGSWVAELEDAKAELAAALRTDEGEDGGGNNNQSCGVSGVAMLEIYCRLCRAYSMLRQWEKLSVVSKEGLKRCFAFAASASSSSNGSLPLERYQSSFRDYRKRARAELSVRSYISAFTKAAFLQILIHEGHDPHRLVLEYSCFGNTCTLQDMALTGDLPGLEAIVARGAAIDVPFRNLPIENDLVQPYYFPRNASALLMTCVAMHLWTDDEIFVDDLSECTMQLVRLGANPRRTLDLSNQQCSQIFRIPEMDGKSAFQIAAMTNRRPLVAHMWEHMQLSPRERSEIVHCRCGSRLPWKMCHSTGIGQPPTS